MWFRSKKKLEKIASLIRMYSVRNKMIYPTCLVFLARLVIMEENDASIFFQNNNYFLENEDFSTPYEISIKFRLCL